MAAFFPNVLDKFLSPTFLEEVRKKFHYDETQIHEFQAVAEEMLPVPQSYSYVTTFFFHYIFPVNNLYRYLKT